LKRPLRKVHVTKVVLAAGIGLTPSGRRRRIGNALDGLVILAKTMTTAGMPPHPRIAL